MGSNTIIGSALLGITGGFLGSSIDKQKEQQEEYARTEQERIEAQEEEALDKRKSLIDQQRYSILGDTTTSSNYSSNLATGTTNILGTKLG